MSSRNWVFTLNNYTDEETQRFRDWEKQYMALGFEVGDQGTPHLQGFIIFKRTYRLSQLRKLSPRTHWEPAKAKDAANYCMKEKYEIEDNRKGQGSRSDLEEVKESIDSGSTDVQLWANHFQQMTLYHRSFSRYQQVMADVPREQPPNVIWIYGPTGVGKSRHVWEQYGPRDVWPANIKNDFYLGYKNQPVVLFDDFRKNVISFRELLQLTDRYPTIVNVKGGERQFNSPTIYIISNVSPQQMYPQNPFEDPEQLIRRITEIKKFPEDT